MLSREFIRIVTPKVKVLNIIWGAFLAACIIYVFIAWILFGQAGAAGVTGSDEPAPNSMLTLALTGAAILSLGASFVVERIMLSPSRLESAVHESHSHQTHNSPRERNGFIPNPGDFQSYSELPDNEKRLADLFPVYQTTHIIIWALREAVVVMGLVLTIMQGRFQAILPFAVLGLAALLLKAPRPVSFFERQGRELRNLG
ncbi:hypothetical protein KJ682_14715 [bacterium]|nr:hypothetical protein [bacterium]